MLIVRIHINHLAIRTMTAVNVSEFSGKKYVNPGDCGRQIYEVSDVDTGCKWTIAHNSEEGPEVLASKMLNALKSVTPHDTIVLKHVEEVDLSKIEEVSKKGLPNTSKDPKYLGIPNICFSLVDKDDDREKRYSRQRRKWGFDMSETWSLRDTIANFIVPRMEKFIEIQEKTTELDDSYRHKRDTFLEAMKLISRDKGSCTFTRDEENTVNNGLRYFEDIFMSLWW